jgi:hypothetical protein
MRFRRTWDQGEDHIQVTIGSVFYTYKSGSSHVDKVLRNLSAFVLENAGPVGYLFHVVPGANPPSADERARTTEMFNRHASKLSGVAVVIEATGISGALVRSAVTMVFDMTRRDFETRTFEDVVAASAWLAPKQWMGAAELVTASAEARAALAAGRALLW